jgi:hypothetical protein
MQPGNDSIPRTRSRVPASTAQGVFLASSGLVGVVGGGVGGAGLTAGGAPAPGAGFVAVGSSVLQPVQTTSENTRLASSDQALVAGLTLTDALLSREKCHGCKSSQAHRSRRYPRVVRLKRPYARRACFISSRRGIIEETSGPPQCGTLFFLGSRRPRRTPPQPGFSPGEWPDQPGSGSMGPVGYPGVRPAGDRRPPPPDPHGRSIENHFQVRSRVQGQDAPWAGSMIIPVRPGKVTRG